MFSQVSVCPQGRTLYDVTSCLAAWSHDPPGGGSPVAEPGFPRGGGTNPRGGGGTNIRFHQIFPKTA